MRRIQLVCFLTLTALLFPSLSASAAVVQNSGVSMPDDKKGHQIQVVYVETQSSVGSKYHTSGRLAQYVTQIQSWLKSKTGKELIFDTYQGQLDIGYLKYEGNVDMNNDEDLVRMYQKLNPSNSVGTDKSLAFIIDQKLRTDEGSCGWASLGGGYSVTLLNWD